ncbi:hypothetical protein [Thioalkalivibrio sp.]|uniref:hypothetical protein n=1 Tax=Thioalkalivibrio sp. TaxID=2093813 RepID=UPI003974DE93
MPTPHNPPAAERRALRKLGADIRDVPRRRRLPMAVVAERAFTSRSTLQRVEAVAEKVGETEQRNAFRDEAQQRDAQIIASGDTIPWSEMRDYLTERGTGRAGPGRRWLADPGSAESVVPDTCIRERISTRGHCSASISPVAG